MSFETILVTLVTTWLFFAFGLPVAIRIVRHWTLLYTRWAPESLRKARRMEIESDLADHVAAALAMNYRPAEIAAHILARWVTGIPEDLGSGREWFGGDGRFFRWRHRAGRPLLAFVQAVLLAQECVAILLVARRDVRASLTEARTYRWWIVHEAFDVGARLPDQQVRECLADAWLRPRGLVALVRPQKTD